MQDKILNGKEYAKQIREQVKKQVQDLKDKDSITPGLAVVLVGEDPASVSYVNMKGKACQEVGFYSKVCKLEEDTSQEKLISLIDDLNRDKRIHGILVQLPLPKHLDEKIVNESINPAKDVDGFSPINLGKLLLGQANFIPCTPKGIIKLMKYYDVEIKGKNVVVVGRSDIVGKPVAILLVHEDATVTLCHSQTRDLAFHTKQADIIIAAVGKAHFITEKMVKEGAVIIDAGTSKINNKVLGDVDYQAVYEKASKITPVPGGVGPMTIAMLLENTLEAVLKP